MEREPEAPVDDLTERFFSFFSGEKEKGRRIDTFVVSQIQDLTRSRIQDLIRDGFVRVNDRPQKPSYRLKDGDRVTLVIPLLQPYVLEPEPVGFSVVHEDSSLLVLSKPAGVVTHPAPGHPKGTVVHGLLQHCKDLSGIGGTLRPGIVHRLDKDTSGLMVVAKNDHAHHFLSKQFKTRTVRKRYLALVHGLLKGKEGEWDLPIARHRTRRKEMAVSGTGGKRAVTLWRKVEELAGLFTLLSVHPKTGRTHQIRVHLSHAGHPIVGDPVYGYRQAWWKRHFPYVKEEPQRQMLHAEALGFEHPDSGAYCEYHAPLPEDMGRLIETLKSVATLQPHETAS